MAGCTAPIRVLLVDGHEHVLWGLNKLIEGERPHMMVAGIARTLSEAITAARECRPDVALLDLYLEGESSLERLPELLRAGAGAVLVVTGTHDPNVHRRALECGALAVVQSDGPAEALLKEIEVACVRGHAARAP